MSFQVPTNRLHMVLALWGSGPAERGSSHSSSRWNSGRLCARLRARQPPFKDAQSPQRSGRANSRGSARARQCPPCPRRPCQYQGSGWRLPQLPPLNRSGHWEGHVGMGMWGYHHSRRVVRGHCSGVSATRSQQAQEHCIHMKPSSDHPTNGILLLSLDRRKNMFSFGRNLQWSSSPTAWPLQGWPG